MRAWVVASVVSLVMVGCGGDAPPPVGRLVQFEPPAPQDVTKSGLPVLENGNYFASGVPELRLEIDPKLKDPITAVGACTYWVTSCMAPPERTLDDCVRSAPACATARPWEETTLCCPAACASGYATERRKGTADMAALQAVFFDDAACFPGVRQLLGRN